VRDYQGLWGTVGDCEGRPGTASKSDCGFLLLTTGDYEP